MALIENDIVERERKKWFDEKIEIINANESEIIRKCEISADERELVMMEIIEKKDARIKDLELAVIDIKNKHRSFNNQVEENEAIISQFNTDLGTAALTLQQLSGKFNGLTDRVRNLARNVDKGNKKLIEDGISC
jgi:chromosome segregation ATPase